MMIVKYDRIIKYKKYIENIRISVRKKLEMLR